MKTSKLFRLARAVKARMLIRRQRPTRPAYRSGAGRPAFSRADYEAGPQPESLLRDQAGGQTKPLTLPIRPHRPHGNAYGGGTYPSAGCGIRRGTRELEAVCGASNQRQRVADISGRSPVPAKPATGASRNGKGTVSTFRAKPPMGEVSTIN